MSMRADGVAAPFEVRHDTGLRRGTAWTRRAGHAARLILGSIFLFSGITKGLTPGEFAHQVVGYGILPERLSALLAPALIVFELTLGATLLFGIRPILSALASISLLGVFIGIEAHGIAVGRVDACGCFGAYAQRTPAQVIGEDLVFVALACVSIWALRGWSGMRPRKAALLLVVILLLSTAFVVASPSLPFFNLPFIGRLAPGATLSDLDLDKRLPQLAEGRHLVALFDVTDRRAAGLSESLGRLMESSAGWSVLGLTPSTEQEIDAFRWTAVPAFEIKRLDRDVVPKLYRRLPRFFTLSGGRVVAVYDGAPPAAGDLLSWEGS
jgi:uncharacterized membrane protein YphA (DoxX/SURF4 family)